MDKKNVEKRLRNILKTQLGEVADIDLFAGDSKLDRLGLNSITFIKAVVAIENEFGFDFPDEDLVYEKFDCLNTITSYIEKKVKNK